MWAHRVQQYNLRWFEEPVRSALLDAFVELSRSTSIPIATGEHFYGRWDVQNSLAIASVHGAQVIPHGHSLHAAMHVVASHSAEVCPLVEPHQQDGRRLV